MINVAIIEDNHTLRNSLAALINATVGMKCTISLPSLMNVIGEFQKETPDVVILDIGLPNISGIEGVRTIRSNYPNMLIMMFTVFEDSEKIFDAISYGAMGYLLKKTPPDEIIAAILDLAHGGAPMTPSIARKIVEGFHKKPKTSLDDFSLTERERELLFSLVDGLSYLKIAERYCISISTVRTHISSIYSKLHVHSKSQAVSKVLKKDN